MEGSRLIRGDNDDDCWSERRQEKKMVAVGGERTEKLCFFFLRLIPFVARNYFFLFSNNTRVAINAQPRHSPDDVPSW